MPPAAVISSNFVCPMVSPPPISSPHIGGMVIMGEPTVLIGKKPAARMGDQCLCNGIPPHPDVIVRGSATVMIGKKPAAYLGCNTGCGGVIVMGEPTVMIGA